MPPTRRGQRRPCLPAVGGGIVYLIDRHIFGVAAREAPTDRIQPPADRGRGQVIPRRRQGSQRCPLIRGGIMDFMGAGVTTPRAHPAHRIDLAIDHCCQCPRAVGNAARVRQRSVAGS